jgi:DNA-binding NarL/FixJ family response regulator
VKTKLVIADDHEILRDALTGHAEKIAGFDVVGSVGDAQAAVNICARHRPDLLLLDLEMPGRDALAAIADVRVASPKTRVVVLTAYCRDAFIQLALDSGAAGYLLKTDSPSAIFESLEKVVRGETAYSKPVLERMLQSGATRTENPSRSTRLSELTPRELEVLRYIGRGADNEQMARAMSLSKRTVERHVSRLMDSLAIRDRAGLQRFAHEQKLTV